MNRSLNAAFLAALALGLSACAGPLGDFRPLYGTAAGPSLTRIETRAPDGRAGYILREQLDDALALDRGRPPLYRLVLTLKETRTPRGLRIDNVANRYELVLRAQYTLVEIATRQVLTRGAIASTVTYDSADQPYAAVAAHEDGQKRVATDAALRLRIALASYFANPAPDAPAQVTPLDDAETLTDRLAPQDLTAPADEADDQPGQGPAPAQPPRVLQQ